LYKLQITGAQASKAFWGDHHQLTYLQHYFHYRQPDFYVLTSLT